MKAKIATALRAIGLVLVTLLAGWGGSHLHQAAAPKTAFGPGTPSFTDLPCHNFYPAGNGGDDGARATTQIASDAATGHATCFLGGTYTIATPINLVSFAAVRLFATAVLNSTLTPTSPNGPSVFAGAYAPNPPVANHTTLNGAPAYGATSVTLTSATGYTASSLVWISDTARSIPYQATNLVGSVLTVDRPILWPFANGADVYTLTSILHDVSIVGERGATVQGTGADGGELIACWRCRVSGIRWRSSFTYKVFSFDWGGLDDVIEDNEVEFVSASSGSPAGFMLEDAENGTMRHNVVRGAFQNAFIIDSGRQNTSLGNSAIGAAYGFTDEADPGGDTLGCLDTVHTGDAALFCTAQAFNLLSPGDRTKLFGISSYGSPVGIEVAHTNSEIHGFSSVGHTGTGLSTNGTSLRAFGVYTHSTPGSGAVGVGVTGGDSIIYGLITNDYPAVEINASNTTLTVVDWKHDFGVYSGYANAYTDAGSLANTRFTCRDCTFNYTSGTGNKVAFQFASPTTVHLEKIRWIGADANAYVLYDTANSANLFFEGNWEVAPAGHFLLGTPAGKSIGTVTCNGASAVDVAFAPIAATSTVLLSRVTKGSTPCTVAPAYTISAASKFSVTCTTTSCNDVLAYQVLN